MKVLVIVARAEEEVVFPLIRILPLPIVCTLKRKLVQSTSGIRKRDGRRSP